MKRGEDDKLEMPKITRPFLRRVLSYLKPYKTQMFFIAVIITISSVMAVIPAMLTGRIIDDGFLKRDFNMLLILVGMSFGVFVASNLIGVLQSYISAWVSQHIVYDMRNQMFRHLEHMPHKFFTNTKQGEITTRMTGDIGGIRSVINDTFTNIFSNIIIIITTAVALFSKDVILALFGLLVVPLFILPTKKVGKTSFNIASKSQAKHDEMNQILNETMSVSGSLLLKLFTKENHEYEKYKKTNGEITDLAIRESMAGRWFRMAIGTFMSMGPMLIYLAAGIIIMRFGNENLTVGDITVMIALVNRLYGPVSQLFNIQIDVTRSMALFSRIFNYFDMPLEIESKPDAVIPEKTEGGIEFKEVGFHYNSGTPILQDISFNIEKGKTTALVGASGAGKSTITNLIPRLYDTISGEVLIDGVNIKDLDLAYLRENIGYVTQDTYLFNGTIRENLLYAKTGATQKELDDACRKANIYDFIMSLPEKYDTNVGNRGLKLSGGEKQRISIARVILKDPQILILDEATSSLDSISESAIQDAIQPLFQGRTNIVIAHRLSTIFSADEILVIDNGKIVERGVHSELINTSGIYKLLYETQFKKARN
jgi:ATP-binding cassette subfamily B protein